MAKPPRHKVLDDEQARGGSPKVEVLPPTDGRHRTLLTLQSVKFELAETINRIKSGALPEKQGRAIIYGCISLAEVIKATDVETLLKRIEARIGREEQAEEQNGNGSTTSVDLVLHRETDS